MLPLKTFYCRVSDQFGRPPDRVGPMLHQLSAYKNGAKAMALCILPGPPPMINHPRGREGGFAIITRRRGVVGGQIGSRFFRSLPPFPCRGVCNCMSSRS